MPIAKFTNLDACNKSGSSLLLSEQPKINVLAILNAIGLIGTVKGLVCGIKLGEQGQGFPYSSVSDPKFLFRSTVFILSTAMGWGRGGVHIALNLLIPCCFNMSWVGHELTC